jgi:DNA-binding transcriptional MerR regulator
MLIGELAARAGVTPKAIRYYERRGFIKAARKPSGYRDFDEISLDVIQTIRSAQRLGVKLSEMDEIIGLVRDPQRPHGAVYTTGDVLNRLPQGGDPCGRGGSAADLHACAIGESVCKAARAAAARRRIRAARRRAAPDLGNLSLVRGNRNMDCIARGCAPCDAGDEDVTTYRRSC